MQVGLQTESLGTTDLKDKMQYVETILTVKQVEVKTKLPFVF